MTLEFRVLGEVSLLRDGVPVEIGGRRPRAMLALLVLHRGRPVTVESIVDRLWPDDPPDSAIKTIQVYVSRIRAALGPERDRIVSRSGAYQLDAAPADVDAEAFAADVATGRSLASDGSAEDTLAALDRAVARFGGRPFGDLADEPFLRAETQRLEDLEAEAQELRADALVALGRAPDAIGTLRRLVADQPARERAWSRLLLALYAAGRQAHALDAYHQARAYLDDELGIEPGPELQAAHLAVLQQSVALPAASQAATSAGRAGTAPIEIEPEPARLVGRAVELDAIHGAFAAGARLITLTGPGGIGKTTLWRAALARGSDGPVVPVELEAIADADLVPAAVAAAIGGQGDAIEQLRDTDALIGLDNLEQVIDVAPWVATLLAACPRIRVLATSREPLHLEGEHVQAIAPLEPDAARELFLARARRVRPELAPSQAIDAVCERLDRMPLAIELAAARTSLLSPAALLARLDRALDVLGETPRDRSDRQRTLRSTIAWSYDLLEPELQRVFRRLSVFVGGFGVEAAESVAGASLDDLDKLLTQSLVVARYDADEPRFRMLETIRAFATERLVVDDDAGAVRGAHAAWALALVDRARAAARRAGDAVDVLAPELDNLRAVMHWAASGGEDETHWKIAVGLSELWQTRGHLAEARTWIEEGLDVATLSDELRAEALDDASTIAFRQRRLEDARHLAERQLELGGRLAQPRRIVSALAKLAQIALRAGDPDATRRHLAAALALAEQDADRRPLLVTLSSQANADLAAGRADLAASAFETCLELAIDVAGAESIATAWFNLGLARLLEGRDPARAEMALREALDRYVALDDLEGIGYVLVAAARAVVERDPRLAARALAASSAVLVRADAGLEVVESGVRESVEAHLRDALSPGEAEALAVSAGDDAAAWIGVARAALGEGTGAAR